MVKINHRTLFKVFLLPLLIFIVLFFIQIYNPIFGPLSSDSAWGLLMTVELPSVLFILISLTLISSIISMFIKREYVYLPTYIIYWTFYIIFICYMIWMMLQMYKSLI